METPIEPAIDREHLPLSFAQERLWFLDRMGAGGGNNIPLAVRLRGSLDPGILEQSLQTIVDRHEILRSGYPAVDGVPRVVVADSCPVVLRQSDFGGMPSTDRETISLRLAQEEALRPIDLGTPSLLRLRLLTFDEDDFVLLLTAPHIIWDRWSSGVLMEELTQIYSSHLNESRVSLPALPIQYADFASWQRQRFLEHGMDRSLEFWRSRVTDLPGLDLPFDFPRPAAQAAESGVVDFTFPQDSIDGLLTLSSQTSASLAVVLLAVWKAYLARICRSEEVVVGVPFANRLPLEVAPLIGLFVNPLVMRADLSDDPSFLETWLPRVRDVSLDAYDHPEIPFEKLLDELELERDASRHPLFQVLFSMQHQRREELRLGEAQVTRLGVTIGQDEVELVQAETIRSPMDLELRCIEHDGSLFGRLVYDRNLFERATISRMADGLIAMMEGILARPEARLSELPVMSAGDAAHSIQDWIPAPADPLEHGNLYAAFASQLQTDPDALALLDPASAPEGWTFAELDLAARRVAASLLESGCRAGDKVGVSMPRSCWSVISTLGIFRSGCVVVPIDPEDPAKRRDWIVQDADLQSVLTEPQLHRILDEEASGTAECLPSVADDPDDPAYLLYTSGSTGRPKGVVGTHRGVLRCITWEQETAPWEEGEVGCHQTKIDFVDSLHEVFSPLLNGRPVLVVHEKVVRDPVALLPFLAENDVSRITLVPSLLDALLDTLERRPIDLPRLRRWVSSGELLRSRTARRFYTRFPTANLWNMYGSTETAGFSTAYLVRPEEVLGNTRADVPIGLPLSGMRVYLLDSRLAPVPLGMTGEICIGGEGVALGYWHNEAMTREKFLDDPYRTVEGARMYRSGDMGRRRADGVVDYLGREDHMVNVRGVRIELEEIGSCLEELPEVQAAVAVVWERASEDQCLVAHVVLQGEATTRPDQESTRARLQEHARDTLPPFFRPARFLFHDRFPRTSSGKVDRRSLPSPDADPQGMHTEPPRPGMETRIAEVWSEFLQIDAVGRNDLFIDAGGHSLLAVRVVSELEKRVGIKIPVADLIYRSLAQIAASQEVSTAGTMEADPNPPVPTTASPEATPEKGSWLSRILKRPS
ncbi:MAG: non-ribosomal peptide synthetase [Planctomycetota bacterium]